MARISFSQIRAVLTIVVLSSFLISCATSANSRYFGLTEPPKANVMRYISGSEPESLDPQFVTGQPEARLMMAIYDGLVEYHPKTMEPIPAIAESWKTNSDGTEYLFHLRKTAKFSNGDPITAKDFAYSIRRGLSPELASRNANLAYYIKYAEAYNSDLSFVKDANGQFLLKKDFEEKAAPAATVDAVKTEAPKAETTVASNDSAKVAANTATTENFGAQTAFRQYITAPLRLTVPSDEKERNKILEKNAKLKTALAGNELVPVKAEDIGVEAVDDYTFRITLYQPAPFFLGLLAHQFFRVVHQPSIEKFGKDWVKPENIVTSGAFKVAAHRPYDEFVVTKDANYWDAANVKLDGIEFYPLEEQTTMQNLYKSGAVDATYNHTVPAAWNEVIRQYKDEYSLHPEVAVEYYSLSVKKPPMDNINVRKAFSLAIDRDALAQFRKTIKPLVDFTPEGIFPKYEAARKKIYTEELTKQGSSLEEWKARKFDAEKARKMMTDAGFPVQKAGNGYVCPTFPVEKISITYNTAESNQKVAEFVQAQWKQNLGITVPLKNMEFKTFLPYRSAVEYAGAVRNGWVGDYMDPFTFLNLFYSPQNDGATGWWDPKYDKMLDDANQETDEMKRYEMLARAELYVMQQAIVIPLGVPGTSWMKKPYVKGMYPNPGTLHPWKFVYLERDPNKWTQNIENIMSESDPATEAQIKQLTASQEEMQKSKQTVAQNNTAE
ncbi:MAG TPA: peptide ABC transporter substrate-binding protein [Pyrinomonadaceae bacterium]